MCEWMSQKTGTMPGRSNRDRAGPARRIPAEIERLAARRARRRCETSCRCSGSRRWCPTVMASTCGTNCSPRWSMRARPARQSPNAWRGAGFEVDDSAAPIDGSCAWAPPDRRRRAGRRSGARAASVDAAADRRPSGEAAAPRRGTEQRQHATTEQARTGARASEPEQDERRRIAALAHASAIAPVVLPAGADLEFRRRPEPERAFDALDRRVPGRRQAAVERAGDVAEAEALDARRRPASAGGTGSGLRRSPTSVEQAIGRGRRRRSGSVERGVRAIPRAPATARRRLRRRRRRGSASLRSRRSSGYRSRTLRSIQCAARGRDAERDAPGRSHADAAGPLQPVAGIAHDRRRRRAERHGAAPSRPDRAASWPRRPCPTVTPTRAGTPVRDRLSSRWESSAASRGRACAAGRRPWPAGRRAEAT